MSTLSTMFKTISNKVIDMFSLEKDQKIRTYQLQKCATKSIKELKKERLISNMSPIDSEQYSLLESSLDKMTIMRFEDFIRRLSNKKQFSIEYFQGSSQGSLEIHFVDRQLRKILLEFSSEGIEYWIEAIDEEDFAYKDIQIERLYYFLNNLLD